MKYCYLFLCYLFFVLFITLLAGAVVTYCNEHVCVSVCLSVHVHISRTTRARSLPNFLCMLPMAVARYFSGGITGWHNSKGKGRFRFFFIDNALCGRNSGMNFDPKDQFGLNLLFTETISNWDNVGRWPKFKIVIENAERDHGARRWKVKIVTFCSTFLFSAFCF